ncbi:kinase-like domain-containing protein [Aspergillus carlsbadensis]|nr:kinase-like domain-containing protein [Aspergillus carlsbadensis]
MRSPVTPSAEYPASEAQERFHRLHAPTEWVEDYRPGKYHPVNFGDTLKGSRYRVIRKLGYGSYSTVWLARDQELNRHVALKIPIADPEISKHELDILHALSQAASEHSGKSHVLTLVDSFEHSGPNGVHRCFVFDIMGPSLATALEEPSEELKKLCTTRKRYPTWMVKSILYQTLLGIDFFHRNGVAHGDLSQSNLLFSVKNLTSVEDGQLARDDKVSDPVQRKDGLIDRWAPKYLALSQPLDEYVDVEPGFSIKISDFGGAFFLSDPPAKLVTPVPLRSPEFMITNTINKDQDIWSLGCLIFELFAGRPLFVVPDMGSRESVDDDHFLQFHGILGPIPHSLWSNYPRAHIYYNDKGELVKNYIDDSEDESDSESESDPEEIEPWEPLETAFDEEKPGDLSMEDAENVKRLLLWILDYDPGKRPSAAKLLEDPWFVGIAATLGKSGED